MKTLEEIKDEVAVQNGFKNWDAMDTKFDIWMSQKHDYVANLYAIQAIDLCAEEAEVETLDYDNHRVDKQSILNVKELLK